MYLKLVTDFNRPLLIQMDRVKLRLIFAQQNLQNLKPALVWAIINGISSNFKK